MNIRKPLVVLLIMVALSIAVWSGPVHAQTFATYAAAPAQHSAIHVQPKKQEVPLSCSTSQVWLFWNDAGTERVSCWGNGFHSLNALFDQITTNSNSGWFETSNDVQFFSPHQIISLNPPGGVILTGLCVNC